MTAVETAVREYLFATSIDSRKRVAIHFENEVVEFARLTAKITETLQRYRTVHPGYDENKAMDSSFRVMTKAANTLVAGFETALNGYRSEPPMLFRVALEGFIVGWDLAFNKHRFEAWKTKKQFDATFSVSNIKKDHPTVVQIWGQISNIHIHPTSFHSWPDMHLVEDQEKFQFFGLLPLGKEVLRKGEVYISLLIAYTCLQLTETVFHAYSSGLETMEKIPNTDTVRMKVSDQHRVFVAEMEAHFRSVVDGDAKIS